MIARIIRLREAQLSSMCLIDQQIALSETENGKISWCKCCKMYSLAYKSSCIVFDQQEFDQFGKLLNSLRKKDFHYQLSDPNQVLIKNPASKVGLCLTELETSEVRSMMKESQTLSEAFRIIY